MPGGIKPRGKYGIVDHDIPGNGLACTYCVRKMVAWTPTHPTKDHFVPRSRGGRHVVWACYQCNQLKRDLMPDEWDNFMHKNPRWWATPGLKAPVPQHYRSSDPCPVMVMVAEFFVRQRYGAWKPR